MENAQDKILHIREKYELNPGETAYFEKMVALMGEDGYWEEYAASVKSMGMAQLEWLEPEDFAASVKIEMERKADVEKKPEQVIKSFGLNLEEQAYLMKMIETSEDSDYVEAYAESIKSMGLEPLQWIEPKDFAASVRLEEDRKTEVIYEAIPETQEQREARKKREAKVMVKKGQHLRYGRDVIHSADEFMEKNQLLLEEREEKLKPSVSIKFQRQRKGGLTRNQLRTDFDNTLAESIKYDVMLELINEKIEKEKRVLLDSYPDVKKWINQLLWETIKAGGDTPEANQIKEQIRIRINNQRMELNFVKLFRNLADRISDGKEISIKAKKYEQARDEKAKVLGIVDEVKFLYNAKKPAIKASVIEKPFTY